MGAVRFLSPPRERNPRQRFCAGAYDTLTGMHGRVEAVSHEEVIHRLLNDERGSFNPVLLSCLFDLQSRIPDELEAALLTPPPREFDLSLI